MSNQVFTKLNLLDLTLFYGTGNVVTAAVAPLYTITKTGLGTASAKATHLFTHDAEDTPANEGTFTIDTITGADAITVVEALTANADDDSIVLHGEWQSSWHRVEYYSRIVGPVVSDVTGSLIVDWSPVSGTTGMSSVTTAIVAGTPLTYAAEIIAPYVRFRIRNNGAALATITGCLYAKALT
jgi:hypothetical protein